MHWQAVTSDFTIKTTAYSYRASYKKLKISILFSCFTSLSFMSFIASFRRQNAHVKRRNTEYKSENSKVKTRKSQVTHELKTSLHNSLYDIQLMHSTEVNSKFCQPGKVMFTEAKQRWISLSRVDKSWCWPQQKKKHQMFCYMTIFSCLTSDKSDVDRSLNFARPFVKRLFLAVWQQWQKRCLLVLDLSQAIFNKQQLMLANIRICQKTTTKNTHKKPRKTVTSSFSQIKKTFAGSHITIYFVTYRIP